MTDTHFLSGFYKRAAEYGISKEAFSTAELQEMLAGKLRDAPVLDNAQNAISSINAIEAIGLGGAGALAGASLAPKGKGRLGALLGAGLGGYAGQRDDVGFNVGDVESARRVLHHAGR